MPVEFADSHQQVPHGNRIARMKTRTFAGTPIQEHYTSELPSLPGTKAHNCFLASDGEVGLINYRNLLCLRKCCLVPSEFGDKNVPQQCELKEYTGRWKFFSYVDRNMRGIVTSDVEDDHED